MKKNIYEFKSDIRCKIVGSWPINDYSFSSSKAQNGNYFVGLALDEDNESEKTDSRIDKWLEIIKTDFEI